MYENRDNENGNIHGDIHSDNMIIADDILIQMYEIIDTTSSDNSCIFPCDIIGYTHIRKEVWNILVIYLHGNMFDPEYQENLYVMLRNRLYKELEHGLNIV